MEVKEVKTRLVCTVGGSHQPIIKAIREHNPDFVCFVCSDDDPATRSKGSYIQVEGKGNVIKESPKDSAPSLPNIPAQTGLTKDGYEVLRVGADDFDQVYETVSKWLASKANGDARIVADYSGGTKTMSAALVVAALDAGNVELSVVTGPRSNLIRVSDGVEAVMPASVKRIRFRRNIQKALEAWAGFSYAEALGAVEKVPQPDDQVLRGAWQRARDLSRAFSAWDRFDHQEAWRLIQPYSRLARVPAMSSVVATLKILAAGEPKKREALRLFDLWRNAERCAARGRFDDAVARWYRLLEWTAQWLLRTRVNIDTADVPRDALPEGVSLTENREGKLQAGLFAAWEIIASSENSKDVSSFWSEQKAKVQDMLLVRNHSILAHGDVPISEKQWERLNEWTNGVFIPWFLEITGKEAGIRKLPDQLPQDASELLNLE